MLVSQYIRAYSICRLCGKAQCFTTGFVFVPIKKAFISITASAEVLNCSKVPRCHLFYMQRQTRLLRWHQNVYFSTSELKQPKQLHGCHRSSTDVASIAKSALGKLSTQLRQNCCSSSLAVLNFFFFVFLFSLCLLTPQEIMRMICFVFYVFLHICVWLFPMMQYTILQETITFQCFFV